MGISFSSQTIPSPRFAPRFGAWGHDPLVNVQKGGRVYQVPLSQVRDQLGGGGGRGGNDNDWWERLKEKVRSLLG